MARERVRNALSQGKGDSCIRIFLIFVYLTLDCLGASVGGESMWFLCETGGVDLNTTYHWRVRRFHAAHALSDWRGTGGSLMESILPFVTGLRYSYPDIAASTQHSRSHRPQSVCLHI